MATGDLKEGDIVFNSYRGRECQIASVDVSARLAGVRYFPNGIVYQVVMGHLKECDACCVEGPCVWHMPQRPPAPKDRHQANMEALCQPLKRPAHLVDEVRAPSHYFVTLADGREVECKHIARALGLPWALGNAFKYLWRAGRKTPDVLKDLRKAREMLDDEIKALEAAEQSSKPAK